MNKKKILLVSLIFALMAVLLIGCSSPLVEETADGQKIFISSDKAYQFTAPANWERDHNTISNGATVAASTENQEQALIVLPKDKEFNYETGELILTFEGFNRNILTGIEESTEDFKIISQEKMEIAGYPVIATKITHKVSDKDTISWIYAMDYDKNREYLRINAFTYQPEEEENEKIIEQVVMSFTERSVD